MLAYRTLPPDASFAGVPTQGGLELRWYVSTEGGVLKNRRFCSRGTTTLTTKLLEKQVAKIQKVLDTEYPTGSIVGRGIRHAIRYIIAQHQDLEDRIRKEYPEEPNEEKQLEMIRRISLVTPIITACTRLIEHSDTHRFMGREQHEKDQLAALKLAEEPAYQQLFDGRTPEHFRFYHELFDKEGASLSVCAPPPPSAPWDPNFSAIPLEEATAPPRALYEPADSDPVWLQTPYPAGDQIPLLEPDQWNEN